MARDQRVGRHTGQVHVSGGSHMRTDVSVSLTVALVAHSLRNADLQMMVVGLHKIYTVLVLVYTLMLADV